MLEQMLEEMLVAMGKSMLQGLQRSQEYASQPESAETKAGGTTFCESRHGKLHGEEACLYQITFLAK